MMICAKCKKEMQCVKTGVGADFGFGHVYAGDKFTCYDCGAEVIKTNPEPHYDPELKFHDEYLTMKKREVC